MTNSLSREPHPFFAPWGWGPPSIAAVLAMILALVYHFMSQSYGGFLLNLDEGYIHVVLAKNLASTSVFGLSPGQEGGGTSSPMWTLLMTLTTYIGVRPDIAAVGFSFLSLGFAVAVTVKVAFRMLPPVAAWVSIPFVALMGQQAVLSLSGMEALLTAALMIYGLSIHSIGWTRRAMIVFVIGSLVRPEVILAAFAALLEGYIDAFLGKAPQKTLWRAIKVPTQRFFQVVVYSLAGLAVVALLTRSAPATLAGRRWMYGLGTDLFTFQIGVVKMFGLFILSLWERLSNMIGPGGTLGDIWAAVVFIIAAVGIIELLVTGKKVGRAIALFIPLLIIFVVSFIGHEGHISRYLTPMWLLLPVLTIYGWTFIITKLPAPEIGEKTVTVILAVLLFIGFIPQMSRWAQWHAESVDHLRRVHLEMAYTVLTKVPADETVAAFDIGLMSYRSRHKLLDLGGTSDRELARALFNSEVPEVLRRREIQYVVIPETKSEKTRFDFGARLGFKPGVLQPISTVALSSEDGGLQHLRATQVALPALTLYRLLPE